MLHGPLVPRLQGDRGIYKSNFQDTSALSDASAGHREGQDMQLARFLYRYDEADRNAKLGRRTRQP